VAQDICNVTWFLQDSALGNATSEAMLYVSLDAVVLMLRLFRLLLLCFAIESLEEPHFVISFVVSLLKES